MATKKCPFCAEEIQEEAIKCKHCGEFFMDRPKAGPPVAWYLKTSVFVIALLTVGPFALPLLWLNPKYSRQTKLLWTAVILAVSYALGILADKAVNSILEYYRMAFGGR